MEGHIKMGFIDKKGRLFGKVNIIDFFIVLLGIALIPVLFYLYHGVSKKPIVAAHKWIKVEALVFTMPEFVEENIKPGGVFYDEFGKIDLKLTDVTIKAPTAYKHAKLLPQHSYKVPVFLKLQLLCRKKFKDSNWYYQRRLLVISFDKGLSLDIDNYNVSVFILKIDEE